MSHDIKSIVERHAEGMRSGDSRVRMGTYTGMYDFVARNGREFIKMPRSSKYRKGMPKRCFANAGETAVKHKLWYVEGYALLGDIGFLSHHAWCVLPGTEQVIDVTSSEFDAYFGIAFRHETWRKMSTPENCSLIDRWQERWPLLRMDDAELQSLICRGDDV